MSLPLVIKHSGRSFRVDVDSNSTGLQFKQQLETITGVVPSRQKILVKGGQIKDDQTISSLDLKPNSTLMMLGSAGELPRAPPKLDLTPKIEDLPPPDPSGLVNTGNTCYANSTIQVLRSVPEVDKSLVKYEGPDSLLKSFGDMVKLLDKKTMTPIYFLMALREEFPQFAERDPQTGMYKQQDAEEMWTQLIEGFRRNDVKVPQAGELYDYFAGTFEEKLVNLEAENEAPQEKVEQFSKLSCHITIQTNFLRDGLLNGLTEELEKHSEELGRDAKYRLTKRISRLPKYLTVQMVRFFWRRDTREKSKILRKVSFPFVLDVCDFCTDSLRAKLLPARDALRDMENEFEDARRVAQRVRYSQIANKKDKIEDTLPLEKQKELRANVESKIDPDLAQDKSCNPFGVYDLHAVITHRGQSADSGHYIAFVRSDRDRTKWWCFNDEKVSLVEEQKIESLAGGGESDSALILLYSTPSLEPRK